MEPIYIGWNTRYKIGSSIKRAIINLGRSGDGKRVFDLSNKISKEFNDCGLDNNEGRLELAEEIATKILTAFADDNVDVKLLQFHSHLKKFAFELIQYEELFDLPSDLFDESSLEKTGIFSTPTLPRSKLWLIEDKLNKLQNTYNKFGEIMGYFATMIHYFVEPIVSSNPNLLEPIDLNSNSKSKPLLFAAPLAMVTTNLADLIETMVQLPHAPEFEDSDITSRLKERIEYNVVLASGGVPGDSRNYSKQLRLPTKSQITSPNELVKTYLDGTPMMDFFDYNVPIQLPDKIRFEHQHIVAGTGHGKTQTLQHLILHDLKSVMNGGASIVVIDSQGDLIKNISGLSIFAPGSPLAEKLIIIDPTDVEYPVALNLFDVGMERINQYSKFDKERLVNGVLELYDFVLGSLLGAEMTQKQSVIFRYIMRLLLHIPDATIHTLRELLEDGGSQKYQKFIDQLQGSSKAFFDTEFDSKEFSQTKRQVIRRLWGILENQTFERMFSHPKNKLDLYTELNAGKVILVNTSKDLLKENGTEILGRFFIAMIAQAAQERASINEDNRMPTFVYIDEANDYFDRNIGIILSQARKYKVGMILAHQYLGQLEGNLKQAFASNTSIKFAGGVSSNDAKTLAADMRTSSDFIEAHDKLSFAAYINGITKEAMSISIVPGQMEKLDRMTDKQIAQTRERMRKNYAVHYSQARMPEASKDIHETQTTKGDDNNSDRNSGLSDNPSEWN